MRRKDLSAPEVRVLGCLIEKQRTTPDIYPLTLNALRSACNQTTNRDPVVDYDDGVVRGAVERLARQRLVRYASGHGSRAAKYRHLLREETDLGDDELALLCVLMLRGPQTPGELKARAERLHSLEGLEGVLSGLRRLTERELVARLGRRLGQKEERYAHRLSEDAEDGEERATATPPPDGIEPRLERLERELAELRDQVRVLRRELAG